MLKDVSRSKHPSPQVDWPELPLPLGARERWRIGAVLILLAILGFIALVVSFLVR